MDYDVIIANGVILRAEGERKADVAIRGETIAAVGPGLAAAARDVLGLLIADYEDSICEHLEFTPVERLRHLIEEHALTQAELSRCSGIAVASLSRRSPCPPVSTASIVQAIDGCNPTLPTDHPTGHDEQQPTPEGLEGVVPADPPLPRLRVETPGDRLDRRPVPAPGRIQRPERRQ